MALAEHCVALQTSHGQLEFICDLCIPELDTVYDGFLAKQCSTLFQYFVHVIAPLLEQMDLQSFL